MNTLIRNKKTNFSKRISSVLCCICLLFALLNSSSIYSIYYGKISDILLLASGVLTVLNFIFNIFYLSIKKDAIPFLIIVVIVVTMPSLIHGFTISYIFFFLKLFVVLINLLIYYHHNGNFSKLIYNCCLIVCIWAIINYLYFIFNFSFLPSTGTFVTGWGEEYKLYGFIFFKNLSQRKILGLSLGRMAAPFSEPGVFQFFPNICLCICLFNSSFRKKQAILFIVLVLLSFSLTGYISLAAILMIYSFSKKNVYLTAFFLICGIVVLSYEIGLKVTTGSYLDRTTDFSNSLKEIFEYLPFGIGIGNRNPNAPLLIDSATGKYYTSANFSGFLSFFFYMGFGGLLFVFLCLKGCFSLACKNMGFALSLVAAFVITMLTEPLAFSCITIMFLTVGVLDYRCNNVTNASQYAFLNR